MFLHFLTEETEKDFFLKLAYLLAVAEKDTDIERLPTRARTENPEKGKYEFVEFAPRFPMQTSELLMLRQFAAEMDMTWEIVSSYDAMLSIFSRRNSYCHIPTSFHINASFLNLCGGQTVSQDILKKIASQNSIVDMLKAATDELYDTPDRAAILSVVFVIIFTQANINSCCVEKKKAILMEATAMAYADGTVSDYEQELLVHFCKIACLDKELIDDFIDVTKKLSNAYAKAFELVTE